MVPPPKFLHGVEGTRASVYLFVVGSKRHVREASCEGKQKYADKRGALAAAKRLGLDAYFCHFCRKFHIGHSRLKGAMNRAQRKRLRWRS